MMYWVSEKVQFALPIKYIIVAFNNNELFIGKVIAVGIYNASATFSHDSTIEDDRFAKKALKLQLNFLTHLLHYR